MLHEPLGDDPRHHLVCVVNPLSAALAQRESECELDVFGAGRREAVAV
jgi:hypothetical protein